MSVIENITEKKEIHKSASEFDICGLMFKMDMFHMLEVELLSCGTSTTISHILIVSSDANLTGRPCESL